MSVVVLLCPSDTWVVSVGVVNVGDVGTAGFVDAVGTHIYVGDVTDDDVTV